MEDFLDKREFKLIYYKYKDTPYLSVGISVFLVITGVILGYLFLYPQLSSVFSVRREEDQVRENIAILKENQQFLLNISKGEIDSNYLLASKALPFSKDFVLIYDSIIDVSQRSQVILNDFGFEIGEVDDNQAVSGQASLTVNLSLLSDASSTKRFIDNLYEAVPIAEVKSWSTNDNSTNLSIVFYYDPTDNKVSDPNQKLASLTAQEQLSLSEIKDYLLRRSSGNINIAEDSTQSANFVLPPL